MYIGLGILNIVVATTLGVLLGRVVRERLYQVLPLVIAGALLVPRVLVSFDLAPVYPALFLGMAVAGELQGLLTWGLAGIACDTRQAKRLFPLFGAGTILGAVLGGFGTRALVELVRAEDLLLVWAALLVAAHALARVEASSQGARWSPWQVLARLVALETGAASTRSHRDEAAAIVAEIAASIPRHELAQRFRATPLIRLLAN